MAEEEKFEIVRNINVSLVDEAQANVGVPFKGVDETGIIGGEFGGIKNKPITTSFAWAQILTIILSIIVLHTNKTYLPCKYNLPTNWT